MDLPGRIESFSELGRRLPDLLTEGAADRARQANPWFTRSETERALLSWSGLLTPENLGKWTSAYAFPKTNPGKNILVITAGNLPLVGFHDFLSVLISGNRFIGKLSSRDDILLKAAAGLLIDIEPHFADYIQLTPDGDQPDAVIATGSNNTARYFRNEYGHLPHIIRKNRTSAAILDGTESEADLEGLVSDILSYYGLGCRSVSHLYLPEGWPTGDLIRIIKKQEKSDTCESLLNNYQYQKARHQMLATPFLDGGKMILVQHESLHSPIAVIHYSYYQDLSRLSRVLKSSADEIQCIAGHSHLMEGLIPFGKTQEPELWDYADNVDTLQFLNYLPQR